MPNRLSTYVKHTYIHLLPSAPPTRTGEDRIKCSPKHCMHECERERACGAERVRDALLDGNVSV